LSRHRKIQLSRTKAILLAAGALSVATAASATAATTWTSGPAGPSAHAPGLSVGRAAAAHDGPRLAVTSQLASPQAGVTYQLTSLTFAQRASALRAVQARDAMAQWTAAHKRAAQKAAAARAAAVRAAATSAAATSSPSAAPPGSAQQIAAAMLGSFGWSASEFACLDPLWAQESGWSTTADNAGTGAYGIPQALPGAKMASAGPDWQTDAATQIKWGLGYIKDTYGSPCAAWDHEQDTGWY
jgi:hypothetical protein